MIFFVVFSLSHFYPNIPPLLHKRMGFRVHSGSLTRSYINVFQDCFCLKIGFAFLRVWFSLLSARGWWKESDGCLTSEKNVLLLQQTHCWNVARPDKKIVHFGGTFRGKICSARRVGKVMGKVWESLKKEVVIRRRRDFEVISFTMKKI